VRVNLNVKLSEVDTVKAKSGAYGFFFKEPGDEKEAKVPMDIGIKLEDVIKRGQKLGKEIYREWSLLEKALRSG
jgi:hypothetical protein